MDAAQRWWLQQQLEAARKAYRARPSEANAQRCETLWGKLNEGVIGEPANER